jgi:GT2 family glycosyltransferase
LLPNNSSLVFIIVVNHNGSDILAECLNALGRQTYDPVQIMVVDNGSTDDSVALIQNDYPHVRLIALNTNHGFARAHNIALKQALEEKPRAIAFVNTDAVCHPDWLLSVLAFMEESGSELAQTLICEYGNPERIDSAGIGVSRSLKIYDRQSGQARQDIDENKDIFGPCFAAAAFQAHMFHSLRDEHGYLDETFGSFYEDVDFCFRAASQGYTSGLLAQPLCRHRRSYTADRHPFRKYFYLGRNYFLILAKHIPSVTLLQNSAGLVFSRLAFGLRTMGHPRYFCGFTLGSLLGLARLITHKFSFKRQTHRVFAKRILMERIKKGDYE